jgi:hypothetical protein
LAAIAHQNVDAQGGQRQDQERNQDGPEHVLVDQEGHTNEGEGNQGQNSPAILCDGKNLLVTSVRSFELTVFSVKHIVIP